MGTALGLPSLVYLFWPPKPAREGEWIEIADSNYLPENTPVAILFRRNRVDGWKVISEEDSAWVVKKTNGEVVAFGPQCTHLGCAYHWEESKSQFVCPCHNSLFGIDGRVLSGPALRPLDRYIVRVQGTKILLGALRRSREPSA